MAAGTRLSILFITAPAPVGGLETVIRSIAGGLQERGHRVRVLAVVTTAEDSHPFIGSLRRAGVDTLAIVLPPRAYVREVLRVRRAMLDFEPDVIHTHGTRSDVLHFLTARALEIPIVSTLHGSSRPSGVAGLAERFQARVLRWFDRVIAVSRPLAEEVVGRGLLPSRVDVIRNASFPSVPRTKVEARARLGLPADKPAIGWVGRLIPVKGADVFLDALARLSRTGWHGSIIGAGPEGPRLRAQAARLGLADRVTFHGELTDAGTYMTAFDVVVLSSREEGVPMVLFEAITAGVPIVASAVGGVPDVLTNREALLTPGPVPTAIAQAIDQTLADPSGAASRAAAARKRMDEHFGLQQWIQQHEAVYHALTGGDRAGGR